MGIVSQAGSRLSRRTVPTPSLSPEGEGSKGKIHCPRQHIGLEYHPRAATRRRIIHRPVLVSRKVAQLDGIARPLPLAQRAPRQRHAKRAGEHLGVEGDDLGLEGHCACAFSSSVKTILRPSRKPVIEATMVAAHRATKPCASGPETKIIPLTTDSESARIGMPSKTGPNAEENVASLGAVQDLKI